MSHVFTNFDFLKRSFSENCHKQGLRHEFCSPFRGLRVKLHFFLPRNVCPIVKLYHIYSHSYIIILVHTQESTFFCPEFWESLLKRCFLCIKNTWPILIVQRFLGLGFLSRYRGQDFASRWWAVLCLESWGHGTRTSFGQQVEVVGAMKLLGRIQDLEGWIGWLGVVSNPNSFLVADFSVLFPGFYSYNACHTMSLFWRYADFSGRVPSASCEVSAAHWTWQIWLGPLPVLAGMERCPHGEFFGRKDKRSGGNFQRGKCPAQTINFMGGSNRSRVISRGISF